MDTGHQDVCRSSQADDLLHPPPTHAHISNPPSLHCLTPAQTQFSTPPYAGLYTMFSPSLACHFLEPDFRIHVIGQVRLKICFHRWLKVGSK